ncbi:HAD family hydrolase [Gammaproteobacteria bacterium]|nr:HAD family hydrolase [Gammaproteobacteria bacterium]
MKAYIKKEIFDSKKGLPALFLDRDGVINFNYGYVCDKNNFDFIPGIFELLLTAKKKEYLIVIVTNQAGIGRGYYSENQFKKLTIWMVEEFQSRNIDIDAVFYSPFHPTAGIGKYLLEEDTRKPGSGMFFEATRELNIDINNSIMIGDNISDMDASINAGINNNFLVKNNSNILLKDRFYENVNCVSSLDKIIIGSY